MASNNAKRYAALPWKVARWVLQGQLFTRVRISRRYKLLSRSGLFDRNYYLSQAPALPNPEADLLGHYLITGGFQGLDPNPLFDSDWYLREHPDVAASGINPLVHFVQSGAAEGRDPHPLFDISRYRCSDATISRADALRHYLERGAYEGCQPHLLFDGSWYLKQNPEIAQLGLNPLTHYLEYGWRNHRNPHPLFHNDYYLEQNRDVVEAGVNPLVHYVQAGHTEGRNPNPLFDIAYYLSKYAAEVRNDVDPLMHYVTSEIRENRQPHPLFDPVYYLAGAPTSNRWRTLLEHYFAEGQNQFLSPHALFDVDFYLSQDPDLIGSVLPLTHFIEVGATRGLDPCELFDTSYYLETYPDVRESGLNPLVHYLLVGSGKGYNPNPLFDTAFYLRRYADISASYINPLAHYLESGAFEGRIPSPFFDSLFYLRQNPGLRRARINPLAHYLRFGATDDGKDPNAFFNNSKYLDEHPEIREQKITPLVHFLTSKDESYFLEASSTITNEPQPKLILKCRPLGRISDSAVDDPSRDTLICVSHVSPVPPRAGNEYRLNRLLHWLRSDGYRLITIVSPLPGRVIPDDQIRDLANEFGTAVVCERDGSIAYLATEREARTISALDGISVPDIDRLLNETGSATQRQAQLLEVGRSFCHNALAHLAERLANDYPNCTVLAEYIFMARLFPLLDPNISKIIDTHDVFSSKGEKVLAFGFSDSLSMSAEEEGELLSCADLIIAIQDEERQKLSALVGNSEKVITAGVDFPIASETTPISPQPIVLCIASDNAMNAGGLQQFLQLAWPSIRASVPDAQLLVAGSVCKSVRSAQANVRLLGVVDDTRELYKRARVAINPALAGTGLKIKTLEALSNYRRIVTWPTGTDGMDVRLSSKCSVSRDWFEFGQAVITTLTNTGAASFTEEDRSDIRSLLSSEHVYQSLQQRLNVKRRQLELSRA